MYHRVADVALDPQQTAVSPEHFAQHLEFVARTCCPVHLLDLAEAARRGSIPHRAVALTFDDGYANNFTHAYPLLTAAGVPATIFVAGDLDGPRAFWWDELVHVLLLTPELPARLSLCVAGRQLAWPTESSEQRRSAYDELRLLLRPLDGPGRSQVMTDLRCWAGVARVECPDSDAIRLEQLAPMLASGLVALGAHTSTHPVLSGLAADAQRAEIVTSRQRLEALTGHPVLCFAYPYGQPQHFTDVTVQITIDAGFSAACTTVEGPIMRDADVFRLRRCEMQNWNIEAFARAVNWFFAS